jgi:hypothetical protein
MDSSTGIASFRNEIIFGASLQTPNEEYINGIVKLGHGWLLLLHLCFQGATSAIMNRESERTLSLTRCSILKAPSYSSFFPPTRDDLLSDEFSDAMKRLASRSGFGSEDKFSSMTRGLNEVPDQLLADLYEVCAEIIRDLSMGIYDDDLKEMIGKVSVDSGMSREACRY